MERPILYSTDMVQAILAGRKTQTRRVCKLQPGGEEYYEDLGNSEFAYMSIGGMSGPYKCPFGKPGDLLWVREEHLITISDDKCWITVEFKDGYKFTIYYKELSLNLLKRLYKRKTIGKWQRARFLPKEFARIWIKVTNVRVERLKDISEEDAIAEGVERIADYGTTGYKLYTQPDAAFSDIDAKWSFESLWQSINGENSWEANPWVWVVEFEVVSTTGRANVKEVKA